tara:strand:- start:609 stop:785 length:177 start_codon:yes stop_codon:yes gene_type:complete
MIKSYRVTFQEYGKDQNQTMEIKTKDIDWSIEQIGRNRNIEDLEYKEIIPVQSLKTNE